MDLKGIRKVKTNVNLKMGTVRVPAGEIFDVADACPEWIKRELEHNLGTVSVIDREKPRKSIKSAPKKAPAEVETNLEPEIPKVKPRKTSRTTKTTKITKTTKTPKISKTPKRKKKTDSA